MSRKSLWTGVFVLGAAMVTVSGWADSPVRAILTGGLFLVIGLAFTQWSYRRGRHVSLAQAQEATRGSGGIVFWKPGCVYCERLLRACGKDPRLQWVNVWEDADANAEVRRHNNGDELNPTAVVGKQVLINPSPAELQAALDTRG